MAPGGTENLRLARGQSSLERRAIDAHARRLGLKVCRETRMVLSTGRARGGVRGLKQAGLDAGNARVLGLEALAEVRCRSTLKSLAIVLGFQSEDPQSQDVQGAVRVLDRTANSLGALCERYWVTEELETSQLMAVARGMTETAHQITAALSEEALGAASPADIRQLRRAYTHYVETCQRYRRTYEDIVEKHFSSRSPEMVWLGRNEPSPDPAEVQARNAFEAFRALLSLRGLFARS